VSNLQECRASASPLGRDPAQALSEHARTNMLFPGGSRPTAKEQLCSNDASEHSSLGPGDPGTCCPPPGSSPGISTATRSLSPSSWAFNTQISLLPGPPFGKEREYVESVLALSFTGCLTLSKSFYLEFQFLNL
jgi:hypothetical protein